MATCVATWVRGADYLAQNTLSDAMLLERLSALQKYAGGADWGAAGGAALGADMAALLARASLLPNVPRRVHVRIYWRGRLTPERVAARLVPWLRKLPSGREAYLVRCEPVRVPSQATSVSAGHAPHPCRILAYVACGADWAEELSGQLGRLLPGAWTQVVLSPPALVLLRFSPGAAACCLPADQFREQLTSQLSEALLGKLHAHVVYMSAARTQVGLELLQAGTGSGGDSMSTMSSPPPALVAECIASLQVPACLHCRVRDALASKPLTLRAPSSGPRACKAEGGTRAGALLDGGREWG